MILETFRRFKILRLGTLMIWYMTWKYQIRLLLLSNKVLLWRVSFERRSRMQYFGDVAVCQSSGTHPQAWLVNLKKLTESAVEKTLRPSMAISLSELTVLALVHYFTTKHSWGFSIVITAKILCLFCSSLQHGVWCWIGGQQQHRQHWFKYYGYRIF